MVSVKSDSGRCGAGCTEADVVASSAEFVASGLLEATSTERTSLDVTTCAWTGIAIDKKTKKLSTVITQPCLCFDTVSIIHPQLSLNHEVD